MNNIRILLRNFFLELKIIIRLKLRIGRSPDLNSRIKNQSMIIGSMAACNVFSYYIKNCEILNEDIELKKFFKFYSCLWEKSASQWSQDIFVLYVLGMKEEGIFLEIGGADGYTHSNTLLLEKEFKWKGILVEPEPTMFLYLKYARPNCKRINAGVTVQKDKRNFSRLKKAGQLSCLEEYQANDMHSKKRDKINEFRITKLVALEDLMKHDKFDYFSFDIEGGERKILESINWELIRKPKVITVEHNFRGEDKTEISNILKKNGYQIFFEEHSWMTKGDIWAVLK